MSRLPTPAPSGRPTACCPSCVQNTGLNYYANVHTNETCWELPKEVSGETPAYVKLQNGWFQYTDDDTGRHYYYNNRTEQTVWSLPADAGGDAGYASSDGEGGDTFQAPVEEHTDDDPRL